MRVFFNPKLPLPEKDFLDFVDSCEEIKGHFLFQSSGTTGKPKWVALSSKALEESALAVNAFLQVTSKDVFGLALPAFHVGGYGVIERARVAGASLHEFGPWKPESLVTWMKEKKITVSSLVPTQIYDLVELNLKVPESLRAIVVGGGALTPRLYEKARSLGWPLLPSYGLTECASQVATAELSSLEKVSCELPPAVLLSHMKAWQVSPSRLRIESPALCTAYVEKTQTSWQLRLIDKNNFVLPDKLSLEEASGKTYLKVEGRWDEEYKIMGEWIRWPHLRALFYDLAYQRGLLNKVELIVLEHERNQNALVLLCEAFDLQVENFLKDFNQQVAPFERVTHYFEGEWPKSPLGKIMKSKLMPACLKKISR